MAQFLHIRVQDIDLLIPAFQVHEVVDLDHASSPSDGHGLWRNQVIHQFDLAHLLQRPNTTPTRNYGVVYSPDPWIDRCVLMRIDRVLGLKKPRREELHALPGVSTLAHRIFDAIWTDPQLGHKAYILKSQLPKDFMV